ncbi:hypothetical protein Cgig2_030237 [Carnegiea gigantea]|uniref:Thiamine pyrophosphate enzyme N-terminal TPP-binding domain-containing protein n=1 Tax=Carnegiea gigantea TaxID=171969 RepID=A0A9Q1KHM5_9CARY|nr:hypothetical protein Cgig2_030237 [Carnegiea gigantea]
MSKLNSNCHLHLITASPQPLPPPRKAADVFVEALELEECIRIILAHHKQDGVLRAEGYACATGTLGVIIATLSPAATNLVTCLADAMVKWPKNNMGTNAFWEAHIVDITRSITKHTFLLLDPNDIPRVAKEAFLIAQLGRPGPVLIDIPKDI